MDSRNVLEGALATIIFLFAAYGIWLMMDIMIEATPNFAEHAWKIWGAYIGGGLLCIGYIFTRGRGGAINTW